MDTELYAFASRAVQVCVEIAGTLLQDVSIMLVDCAEPVSPLSGLVLVARPMPGVVPGTVDVPVGKLPPR